MAKVIDLPQGLVFHTDSQKSEFFKAFKKNLRLLAVPYVDACCGETAPINTVFSTAVVENRTASIANTTTVLAAAAVGTGLITSTSVAVVSLTLPTATALATELGAAKGSTFEFVVDNSAGASVVTVVVGAGITVPGTVVITGSATLTVAAAEVGVFKLVFTSGTAAKLFRTS